MQEPQSRDQQNVVATRWIANATIALLPVLACFLGGATQKWEEGLIITFLALYLLVRPPRFSLGALTNLVLLALFILAAVAFFPASWLFQPEWRGALANDFGIQLPSMLTPQPWITMGYLVSFAAGLSWLYVVSTQDLELREVRFQLRLFTSGIAFLAAICIALYLARTTLPFWHNEQNFGPFPNRNQTGDLFGVTAIVILACAQDDLRKRRKRWIVWILALLLIGAAIILNSSASGIAILVVGSAFWLGALVFRQRSPWRLALGISFLLLLLTALLLFGWRTVEGFHLGDFGSTGISTDFSWRIFHDAFRLIRNSPWCGIGFGNLESIFAIFCDDSLGGPRALHPESDWLWLWAELGWPALVLTIVGIAMFVSRVFTLRVGTKQGYRLATLIAALLFAIHGIVDISGHQVGTAFAAILLLGLSLHRPLPLKTSEWMPILFRFVGGVLLAAGLTLVVAVPSEKLLPGSVGVSIAKALSAVANAELNFALPYLDRLSDASFNRALAQLLKNDPNLQSFSETEKLALFAVWSERGNPGELSLAVEQHPDWLRYAWLGMAKHKASRNDFRAAYELTQQYGEPVALPRVAANFSLQDLENRFAAAPNNYGIGYELYRAQMQSGRVDDALLTARHFSERPNSPAYFYFLEAQCWAKKQNWERAWNAWQAFHAAQVRATK